MKRIKAMLLWIRGIWFKFTGAQRAIDYAEKDFNNCKEIVERNMSGIQELILIEMTSLLEKIQEANKMAQFGYGEHEKAIKRITDELEAASQIGIDACFRGQSTVIVVSKLHGGQVRIINVDFQSLQEMRQLVETLRARYVPRAWAVTDHPHIDNRFKNEVLNKF